MSYLVLKWLHVLASIVALGSNVTYGIWIARASRRPDVLPFTLRGIKFIDDRLANPAYGLLLVTGLGLSFMSRTRPSTPWLMTALILYALVLLIAVLGYTPTLKRQIQVLERDGSGSPAYQTLARRGTVLGLVLIVLVIAIAFLMVVQPSLWA